MKTTETRAAAYADFLEMYAGQHCPTAEAQQAEIEEAISELSVQCEFWTLDIIRNLLNTICEDNKRSYDLFFVLFQLTRADDKGVDLAGTFLSIYNNPKGD